MTIVYSIIFFYLGATLASFANCLAYRFEKKEKITDRSYCDNCKITLRFIDVIPIFGYIINLGKCHNCKEKIGVRHLFLELVGAFLFLLSYLIIGVISWELIIAFILIFTLVTESIIDQAIKEVIDIIWIISLVLVVIIRTIQGVFLTYLVSSLGLFLIMLALALLGKLIFKKDSLGGGDIKLYLFIGFLLTFQEGLLSILIASVIGLIYALIFKIKTGKEMAFIPMISIAVYICYFFGTEIINAYFNLFGM